MKKNSDKLLLDLTLIIEISPDVSASMIDDIQEGYLAELHRQFSRLGSQIEYNGRRVIQE